MHQPDESGVRPVGWGLHPQAAQVDLLAASLQRFGGGLAEWLEEQLSKG